MTSAMTSIASIDLATALLLYPGLLFTLGVGLLYAALTQGPRHLALLLRSAANPAAWFSAEGVINLVCIGLAGSGLLFLPWPLHPLPPAGAGTWLLAWGGLEGAFLVALLPGLLAGAPHVVRATIREAQIGAAGRLPLWLTLFSGLLLQHSAGTPSTAPYLVALAYGLIALTLFFALPAAVGWGTFAAETNVTPGGTEQGLGHAAAAIAHIARATRTAALLAASLLAVLPLASRGLNLGDRGSLLLVVGAWLAASALLGKLATKKPRTPMPDVLVACWWRALPLAIAATACLILAWEL